MQATTQKVASRFALPVFALLLVLVLPVAVQAADDYFELEVTELRFSTDNGHLPGEVLDRLKNGEEDNRHATGSLRATVSGGEAYLTPYQNWGGRQRSIDDNVRILVRAPRGADVVQGVLYLPEPYHFALPATLEPDNETLLAFNQAKENYYASLQNQGFAGSAWFRHQAQVARVARLGDREGDGRRAGNQWQQRNDMDSTFAMFSGGRALSENIQLDRLLNVADRGAATEPLDEIEGITIEEVDWEPLLEGVEAELDPLAALVPEDQHALFFPSFLTMANMVDEAQRYGTPLLRSLEPVSEDARTLERYQQQLCLQLDFLSRQLGPHAVKSVAITGSDPYFRTGTDIAVLFETDSAGTEGLSAFMTTRYAAVMESHGASEVKGELAGHEYLGVVTADRSISSYLCRLEGAIVVTNSLGQLEQILATQNGDLASLASLEEYKFFRHRYQRSDSGETAFLMVSDATIRRWCGPRWRIATSRRTRALAILSDLQARHALEVAAGFGAPARLAVDYNLAEMGVVTIDSNGPASSVYGSLAYMAPIRELEFDLVTQEEETAYVRYRDRYQNRWRTFFDPIGVQFTLAPNHVAADVTVMPLVDDSTYAEFIDLADGATLGPQAGDPHAESLLHWAMAVNKDSDLFQSQDNILRAFAPDRGSPLGWLGDSVAVYVDEDPFWGELAACETEEEKRQFMEENYHRMPVAIRAEVGNSLKAAAFLAALRAFIEETAPNMTVWGSETYRDITYVTIKGYEPTRADPITLYYSVSREALVLTLNEDLLKRSLDREIDGAAEENDEAAEDAAVADAGNPHAPPAWLGESLGLRVDGVCLLMLQEVFREYYLKQMQDRCYGNLSILNEWHDRFPDRDPVELHEQLFKTRLVCPGGGEYVWNEELLSMESTVYGSPADPREGPLLSSLLSRVSFANFGLTFENDGLRARMQIERSEE